MKTRQLSEGGLNSNPWPAAQEEHLFARDDEWPATRQSAETVLSNLPCWRPVCRRISASRGSGTWLDGRIIRHRRSEPF